MTKKERIYANFGEYLYWSYANIQMLHYALNNGVQWYNRMCYMIRAKAFKAYKMTLGTGSCHASEYRAIEQETKTLLE